jgi:hypothetical protein
MNRKDPPIGNRLKMGAIGNLEIQNILRFICSADTQKLIRVVIRQPEGTGIAIAIRDRLKRASRGR